MAIEPETTKREPEKATPKTPQQEEQAKIREAIQASYSALYMSNLTHEPEWRRKDLRQNPLKDEEKKPDPGYGQVSNAGIPSRRKINQGWYDVDYYEEEEEERDKSKKLMTSKALKTMTLYVDENGTISPGGHPRADSGTAMPSAVKSPKEHRAVVRQIFHGYMKQGIHELNLDYPDCYDFSDKKHPKPDHHKCMRLSLDDIMIKLDEAEKQKPPIAIYVGTGTAADYRLSHPKEGNKKEEALCKQIYERIARLQDKVANDPILNQKRAEATHPFHLAGLKDQSTALTNKAEELNRAPTKIEEAKLKELETARAEVATRISNITKDLKAANPSPDIWKKYETVISDAGNAIDKVKGMVAGFEVKIDSKDKPAYDKLVTDFATLKTSADDLSKTVKDNIAKIAEPAKQPGHKLSM